MRNLLRRLRRKAAAYELPAGAAELTVSETSVTALQQGLAELVRQRNQKAAEVQRLDQLIAEQQGGLRLMQTMLAQQRRREQEQAAAV